MVELIAFFVTCIATCAVACVWMTVAMHRHIRALYVARQGVTYADYEASLSGGTFDCASARAVYDVLQDWMLKGNFPVLGTDSLACIYGIVYEDVQTLVRDVLQHLQMKRDVTARDVEAVETVKDVVLLVTCIARKAEDESSLLSQAPDGGV